MTDEPRLEADDVQGLIKRSYRDLPEATFLLLAVAAPDQARAYLAGLGRPDGITRATVSPDDVAVHVAFTARGLAALGLPPTALATLPRELLEGMDHPVRAEALGDIGANAPAGWAWGRSDAADPVHAVLMVYARTAPLLAARLAAERAAFEPGAFRVLAAKPTQMLDDDREHFGWRDGIASPPIEGFGHPDRAAWTAPIRLGEFVLGYANEYDRTTESPVVDPLDDPRGVLPCTRDGVLKDLGRNGTYLVLRELHQDVAGLWRYLARTSREPGATPVDRAIALGAKMVGRWPEGAPLATAPTRTDAVSVDNTFRYRDDRLGLGCPIGAHVRRTNPRDHLRVDPVVSEEMVRKHQLLRRGRTFGPPFVPGLRPADLVARCDHDDGVARGLYFACLVGHIGRQFELVQRAWVQSANFGGLFRDGDPLIGARRPPDDRNRNDDFTVPATPARRRYKAMPQFTRLTGGAYFFLPGLRALRFIARAP